MVRKKGLGRGLGALIEEGMEEKIIEQHASQVYQVPILQVAPNPDQPRKYFEAEALKELSDSIALYGIIQPLITTKQGEYYEIIAGERRWRAAKLAGLEEVPVIIKDFSLEEILEVSLIENIQRENLNSIEEALAYKRLMEEFQLTQEAIAEKVSKSRSAIANTLRLLNLDERVQKLIIEDRLSSGHARAILALSYGKHQYDVALDVVEQQLSVRETEKLIKTILNPPIVKEPTQKPTLSPEYIDLENKLKFALGTKVKIHPKKEDTGAIEIEYYSLEELDRITELMRQINL